MENVLIKKKSSRNEMDEHFCSISEQVFAIKDVIFSKMISDCS